MTVWLAFCATEAVLCLTPGPAVLFVTSQALSRGARTGIAAAFGILLANTGYFALSASGVAALLVTSNALFDAVRWAGAAYLIWLGLRMLWTQRGVAIAQPKAVGHGHAYVRGFIVQAANPKTLVFFIALLPQFIDPVAPIGLQLLVLGVSSVVIELAALAMFVVVAARARSLFSARLERLLQRLGSACLVLAGARLALDRSH